MVEYLEKYIVGREFNVEFEDFPKQIKKSPQRCEDAFWAYLGVHPTGVEPVTA